MIPKNQRGTAVNGRRQFLRWMAAAMVVATLPARLWAARPNAAFEGENPDSVLKELFGDIGIQDSSQITLKVPDIAENGAVVPVTVATDLPGVEAIYILVDNNPTPLSAAFTLSPKIPSDVSTRIKMGGSSMVRAMVKTSDGVFTTGKEVKVTIGGCGG
ncbi:MAG: thiosulfate oxidation carrier protein SoxY [Xanthomonadales bacterium]|nr:thiosulfate oxidation carrier protein SoxY [Xanthomonadales bacterium]